MSTHKKISKTIEVSNNLKLRQFDDGSFEIFFRGNPGGYYFVFSENHKLLHRVHKSAYGIGKPDTNEVNNWSALKEYLDRENEKKELDKLQSDSSDDDKTRHIEERLGCISYFKEQE